MTAVRTDEELFAGWCAGNRDDGGRLVDRHLAALHRFFRSKVASDADIEDLVGDTLEACVKARDRFRHEAKFRTFLLSIAHYTLCGYLRKRRRLPVAADVDEEPVQDLGPGPSTMMAGKRERRVLVEALRSLPLMYQVVLELKHFEGMSRSEIAAVLELPEGTVATRVRTGQMRLDEALRRLTDTEALLRSTKTELADWAASLRTARDPQ